MVFAWGFSVFRGFLQGSVLGLYHAVLGTDKETASLRSKFLLGFRVGPERCTVGPKP